MRVLVTSVSGYGHLYPLLPLATALADAGHDVAVATGAELLSRAAAAGFTTFAAGIIVATAFGRLAARFPDGIYNRLQPHEILGWYLPHLFGEVLAPAMLDDLGPIVQTWQPDVIVHDSWEFAAPIAAASAGVFSISQTLGLRTDDALLESVGSAVAPLWIERGLDPDGMAGVYQHLCLDITPPSFQSGQPARRRAVIRQLRPIAQPPVAGEVLPDWIAGRGDVPLLYMTLGVLHLELGEHSPAGPVLREALSVATSAENAWCRFQAPPARGTGSTYNAASVTH